jgi:hypothetical protein
MDCCLVKFLTKGLIFVLLLVSCQTPKKEIRNRDISKVFIREENGNWVLYRNNKPYFIKGAHGISRLDWLKENGGNSLIVYDYQLSDSLLNLTDSLDLSVSVMLDLCKPVYEKQCDYTDTSFVMPQRRKIIQLVQKYYKHPSILFWIIGNEIHFEKKNCIAAWKEVNQISKAIHKIDTFHLTTTVFGGYPTDSYQPAQVKVFAPDIDFISMTIYRYADRVKRETSSFIWGVDDPFMVTEWSGSLPYWNCPTTEWGSIIEQSSTKNAGKFGETYNKIFNANKDKCIGGYVFYWGEKLERTHTTFSLILDEKYKTQAVEVLNYLWNGKKPDTWCSRIDTFFVDGFFSNSTYLKPNTEYIADLKAWDPGNNPLIMKWEIRNESFYAGKRAGEAEGVTDIISKSEAMIPYQEKVKFTAPAIEGEYRLFIYVNNGSDYIATANIPFYVIKGN